MRRIWQFHKTWIQADFRGGIEITHPMVQQPNRLEFNIQNETLVRKESIDHNRVYVFPAGRLRPVSAVKLNILLELWMK